MVNSMDDRELLKLAAYAAGYDVTFEDEYGDVSANGWYPHGYDENGEVINWWNPLLDDGDALRLAVKLQLDVFGCGFVEFEKGSIQEGGEPYAATRRAIVRAAAAIGKDGK